MPKLAPLPRTALAWQPAAQAPLAAVRLIRCCTLVPQRRRRMQTPPAAVARRPAPYVWTGARSLPAALCRHCRGDTALLTKMRARLGAALAAALSRALCLQVDSFLVAADITEASIQQP